MSTHAYTEDQLVEQPAIGLFAELRWQVAGLLAMVDATSDSHNAGLSEAVLGTFLSASLRPIGTVAGDDRLIAVSF